MKDDLDFSIGSLPGKVTISTHGNVADQIAAHFPSKTISIMPHEQVPLKATETFVLVPSKAVDATMMDQLPKLRLIQRPGVGTENIDIDAATERGIFVANVSSIETGHGESVAELAIFHMLALARQYRVATDNLRNRNWGKPEGLSLWGKTVGIYGFGGIGQALARKLRAFNVNLMAIKRNPEPHLAEEFCLSWLGTPAEKRQASRSIRFFNYRCFSKSRLCSTFQH